MEAKIWRRVVLVILVISLLLFILTLVELNMGESELRLPFGVVLAGAMISYSLLVRTADENRGEDQDER